jgi:hypothetical protein
MLSRDLIDWDDPVVRGLQGNPKLMSDGALVTNWKILDFTYSWRMKDYVPPAILESIVKQNAESKGKKGRVSLKRKREEEEKEDTSVRSILRGQGRGSIMC